MRRRVRRVQQCDELRDLCDADGDGKISANEVRQVLDRIASRYSTDEGEGEEDGGCFAAMDDQELMQLMQLMQLMKILTINLRKIN